MKLSTLSSTFSVPLHSVYSQLLALQEERKPFDVITSRRKYANMLIQGLMVTNDAKTSNALMVTATCKQIIVATTQATSLPAREDQANPQATAETQRTGIKSARPGNTAPGGTVTPDKW